MTDHEGGIDDDEIGDEEQVRRDSNNNDTAANNGLSDEEMEKNQSKTIDPPLSFGERYRDALVDLLENPFFTFMNGFVLFLVIADGAAFFFLLMGWQTMCHPRHDCQQRNRGYNITVQILNGLFTYMAVVALPWRCTNFLHLVGWSCPYRDFHPGRNWYGQPTNRIWFHVPRRPRIGITILLLLNAFTQGANQVTRIVYPTYDKQNVSPGNIWVNVFFASSFGFAGLGAAWLGVEYARLRRITPNHPFGPGPVELIKTGWSTTLALCKR